MILDPLAAAIHDAARLAQAVEACGVVIVPCVPHGERGRRDLVSIAAYTEMAFSRNAAERRVAQLERRLAGLPEAEEGEFPADLVEAAER